MDDLNPYAAPAAPAEVPAQMRGTGSFSVKRAWREALDTFERYPLQAMGGSVLFVVLCCLAAATVLGIFLLVPVLMYGGLRWWLGMLRTPDARVGDMFSGFSRYGSALGHTLALAILTQLVGLVGQVPQWLGVAVGSPVLAGVGYLLALVWGFVVGIRFIYAWFYLVDDEQGAVEAMRSSWEATRGQLGSVLLLMAAGTGLTMLGLLAFVVGVIPALVIFYFMIASAYRQTAGDPVPDA